MKNSMPSLDDDIWVNKAKENNLKNLSVRIPKNKYILVTGVSGSGKSSLVHGVIAAEAKRRYLEQLNPRVRTLLAGIKQPDVESIHGLSPVVSLDQVSVSHTIRSTVGTLSGIYDHLRLLFARFGIHPELRRGELSKSHFSFNLKEGACPHCHGIGQEEYIDPNSFIINPEKSVKSGALSLTTPTGYIIYSQVTIDVLQKVCESEGFQLDIPWKKLTAEQKNIIYYGSEVLKVPFGKHTLESRMKWTGITAKPREEGYYRGVLTIMEDILKRDRNKNILRYTKSRICPECFGKRLNRSSLKTKWKGKDLGEWASLTGEELASEVTQIIESGNLEEGESKICQAIYNQLKSINKLGIGYLSLNRESRTLSGGESKRIRLSTLVQPELSGLIYTLDEPTVGLHPMDHENLLELLKDIQDQGNTLICVDHKFFSFKRADYWIEIGPGAGKLGGEIVLDGWLSELIKSPEKLSDSQTWAFFQQTKELVWQPARKIGSAFFQVVGARKNNLKNINPKFLSGALNVICGVSGSGKSSLLNGVLYDYLSGSSTNSNVDEISLITPFKKLIRVNQDPIGRSPRSNPVTYIKAFDSIRDLFASLPESAEKGFTKSHFSFNVAGGRCPKCFGAGKIEIGMSFLGKAETDCDTCFGKRFNNEVLEVRYRDLNIAEVLELEVIAACEYFKDCPEILRYVSLLKELGLGYLHLGQSSNTLSGGEAQRIKLVSELIKAKSGKTLYLLDEPTNGLHYQDINILLRGLEKLVEQGNTIVIVEHDPFVISKADWIIELGPGSGEFGGNIVYEGSSKELMMTKTDMAKAIQEAYRFRIPKPKGLIDQRVSQKSIDLYSVSTNNLKQINVSLPQNQIIAITGISGSGKTSLAFDTLYERAKHQYSQIFSPYIRSLLGGHNPGEVEEVKNLLPAIGIQYSQAKGLKSSTVGTLLGISPIFRLLFSRFSIDKAGLPCTLWAKHFSFLDLAGACPKCHGDGYILAVSENLLIPNVNLSIVDGALKGSKPGAFFSDPHGQYMACYFAMAQEMKINTNLAWKDYSEENRKLILFGTEKREYEVNWNYNRKGRTGLHTFKSTWDGFIPLITEDFKKKTGTTRSQGFKQIMEECSCRFCRGTRIHPDRHSYLLLGKNLPEWLNLSLGNLIEFLERSRLEEYQNNQDSDLGNYIQDLLVKVKRVLKMATDLGLEYLSLDRTSKSLSSGEYQRVRLAGQLESGLTGLMYILDEPGASLHPENIEKLSKIFVQLKEQGNTIIFTEHNNELIKTADYLVELGPGAGVSGGEVLRQGYLSELELDLPEINAVPQVRQKFDSNALLVNFTNISFRNLQISDLAIPMGWVSISGVSGSGKSTLMNEIIVPALTDVMKSERGKYLNYSKDLELVLPTESNGRWSWSRTPMMALDLDKQIFYLLANTPEAKLNNVKINHFYPLRKGLACDHCLGRGSLQQALDFLGESSTPCSMCSGSGYQDEIHQYKIKEVDLRTILEMQLNEVFDILPKNDQNSLLERTISEIGLGYLKLGQQGHTLSSGEQQRLILCKDLVQKKQSMKIFLFDEPTRGLHRESRLGFCKLIRNLVDIGHSVITIDHEYNMKRSADWQIILGPQAGEAGGRIVYNGRPK